MIAATVLITSIELRASMAALLPCAIHGVYSAVGCYEPFALDVSA